MMGPISSWIAEFYFDATVVLVASVVLSKISRQPARRLAIARAAFLAIAATSVIAAAGASMRPGSIGEGVERTDRPAGSGLELDAGRWPGGCVSPRAASISTSSLAGPGHTDSARVSAARRLSWRVALSWVFAAGSASSIVWLAVGALASERLRRRAKPGPIFLEARLNGMVGEGQRPDLRVCDGICQPIALGLLRPTIVLPADFVAGETDGRIASAMAHELGHIRNGDLLTLAISRLLLPILFAHPLYWHLRRRVRADQELMADAVAAGADRVGYAEALLGWAKAGPARRSIRPAPSLGLWETTSMLGERIAALLDGDFRVEPTCPTRWRLGIFGLTVASLIGLSAVSLRAEAGAAPGPVAHSSGCKCCVPPPPSVVFCCPDDPTRDAAMTARPAGTR